MDPKSRIKDDLKTAMKARDQVKTATLRMVQAELQKREIEKRSPLEEAEFVKMVQTMVKQRVEAIEAFKKGGREDLAANEVAESEVLKAYLPQQLSPEELDALVADAIAEAGADSVKQMGQVMKIAQEKAAGRADGKAISQLVRTKLSGS